MRWYLAQAAQGEPEINIREHDEPEPAFSLMAFLASEPGSRLVEIRPGLWIEPKEGPELPPVPEA